MSRLHSLIHDALDQADRTWQHSIAPTSVDQYISDMATAIEASLVIETGGGEHIVRVDADGWVMQHPLPERFEEEGQGASLMDCRFNSLVGIAVEQGDIDWGEWYVWIDPTGVLLWREKGE